MDYFLFFYNIITMAVYIFNCVCFFILYNRYKDKCQLWIALMFLLFTIDNLNLYMLEFLPDFGEFYQTVFMVASHLQGILNGLIVFSYYMVFQSYLQRKISREMRIFWVVAIALRVVVSDIPFDAEYKQALNIVTFVVDIWVFANAVYITVKQRKGELPMPKERFGVPRFSLPFLIICLVLYSGAKLEITAFMYGAGSILGLRFLFIEVFAAMVSVCSVYFIVSKVFSRFNSPQSQRGGGMVLQRKEELLDEFFDACGLSKREKEVGSLMLNGLSNGEIGEKLFISEGTVKMHVHKILLKTGIDSRVKLGSKLEEFYASKSRKM